MPDKYLGSYVERVTKRKLILWNGFCPTHARLMAEDILRAKVKYPSAKVVVHPECRPEVLDLADAIRSTGGMLRYVTEVPDKQFIIGTEIGMVTTLRQNIPSGNFIARLRKRSFVPI